MPIVNRKLFSRNSRIVSLGVSNRIPLQQQSVLKEDTDSLDFGTLVAYNGTDNSTVVPLTATTADAGATWTFSGVFAGFVNHLASEGTETVRIVNRGSINMDLLDLSGVSQTAGEDFTIDDLFKITNLEGIRVDTDAFGGTNVMDVIGVQGV